MPLGMSVAFAGAIGASLGSFLTVVAHRLPRGESLVGPRSRCPRCGTTIRAYDNLPVLSWLLLRGRCRSCRAPISSRYPIVEAATATLAVAVVLHARSAREVALGLTLVTVLVAVTLIDLEHRVIPNRITLLAAILALAIGLAGDPRGVPGQLIAGAAASAFFLVFVLAYPRGMGMGDVKLAGVLGLFLGRSVAVAVLAAVVAGTLVGGLVMARSGIRRGRKTAVPFGPFLAFGGLVGWFAGPAIVHWYLHAFA